MARRDDDEYDVPPWLLGVYRLFGATEIQARWRAIKLLRWLKTFKLELSPPSSRVPSKLCGACGALQRSTDATCASCGAKLTSRAAHVLRRLGLSLPPIVSVSWVLAGAMLLVYVRMWLKFQNVHEALWGWSGQELVDAGSNYGVLTLHGQYYRVLTSAFLHIGVMHIGFNLVALAQVGPTIEHEFGRGRMLFYFLLTGAVAGFASAFLQHANAAGASGALMGLVGIAAGWGQRLGTQQGRAIRDMMLKWGAYTVGFGFMIGADNVAHVAGFVAGAAIGYAHTPSRIGKPQSQALNAILGLVGGAVMVATVALVLVLVGRAGPRPAPEADDDEAPAAVDVQRLNTVLLAKCERFTQHPDDDGALADLEPPSPQRSKEQRRASVTRVCASLTAARAECAALRAGEPPPGLDKAHLDDLKTVCETMP
jgi:rhomboid protease GluP